MPGVGQAINYMMNHWHKLILFCKVPKAPLDNNVCERALKKAILHRKNALFYKTQHGARVGDMMMSLIYTCFLNKINPFVYLTTLIENSERIKQNPESWLPWNYQGAVDLIAVAKKIQKKIFYTCLPEGHRSCGGIFKGLTQAIQLVGKVLEFVLILFIGPIATYL